MTTAAVRRMTVVTEANYKEIEEEYRSLSLGPLISEQQKAQTEIRLLKENNRRLKLALV